MKTKERILRAVEVGRKTKYFILVFSRMWTQWQI